MNPKDAILFAGYDFDLFVVFADTDRDFVCDYLLPALNLPRSRIFLSDELAIGEMRISEIERGVSSSRFTLAVLSPAYLADCLASFGEELASYISLKSVRIIPLLLISCSLPLRLDARVALDFTIRSNWDSEVTRLREFLYAATANTLDSRLEVARSGASGKLEIVDSCFDDTNEDQRFEILDIKIINRSMSTIVITRIDVTVSEIWDVCNPSLARLEPSASYHLDIPMRNTPFVLSKQVSHILKFDEADRLQIVLSATELQSWSNIAFAAIRASIFYGPGERVESTGDLLCAFRGTKQWWIDWTQPIAAALACKVRQRRDHMSRRCLELISAIEARRWAEDIDLLRRAAVFWTALGNEKAGNGQLDSARRYLELALDIRRLAAAKAVATDEGNTDWQHELAASYDRLACLPQPTRQPDASWGGVQVIDHACKVLGGFTIRVHSERCSCLRQVGFVSDEHGRPLPRAHVGIADEGTLTDHDGRFEIHFALDLPKGNNSITVSAAGYEPWRGQPIAGGAPLRVQLSRSFPKLPA
jgi:hypothetical protein